MLPAQVIAERSALAAQGAVHVAVPIDAQGRLAGEIAVATRGVIDEGADGELLEAARKHARSALEDLLATAPAVGPLQDERDRRGGTPSRCGESLAKTLGFKPVTTASLVRVNR